LSVEVKKLLLNEKRVSSMAPERTKKPGAMAGLIVASELAASGL
jgi:hypothetical protein